MLKSKGLWQYTKVVIPDPFDASTSLSSTEIRMGKLESLQPISHEIFGFKLVESLFLMKSGRS